jgi:hypothetical protein
LTDGFRAERARSILAELADLKEQADEIERKRRGLIAQLREMRRAQATVARPGGEQRQQPKQNTDAVRVLNPSALKKIRGAVATIKEQT